MARPLSSALSANVSPVSGTSGVPGNASSPTRPSANPVAARMRDSSAILWWFRVASTTRGPTGGPWAPGAPEPAPASATDGFPLQPGQLRAPGRRQVEERHQHRPAEWLALRRPLNLDEVSGPGADDVHVGLRRRVLLVAQIEPGLAADDADAHRRHRRDQR